jgi:sec-independent protein translocase protein TatA
MNAGVNLALFGPIGLPELLVIFVIVLVIFGANRLPKIAKDLGSGIREFKKSISGESDEIKEITCSKCSTKMPSGTKFCPNCGTQQ